MLAWRVIIVPCVGVDPIRRDAKRSACCGFEMVRICFMILFAVALFIRRIGKCENGGLCLYFYKIYSVYMKQMPKSSFVARSRCYDTTNDVVIVYPSSVRGPCNNYCNLTCNVLLDTGTKGACFIFHYSPRRLELKKFSTFNIMFSSATTFRRLFA